MAPNSGKTRRISAVPNAVSELLRSKSPATGSELLDLESAFAMAPIGMALIDLSGRCLRVNDALCKITGFTHEDLTSIRFVGLRYEPELSAAGEFGEMLLGTRPGSEVERRFRHSTQPFIWVLETLSLVRDAEGGPRYAIAQIQSIAERKQSEDRSTFVSDHDHLTGLHNRRRFEEELAQESDRVMRYGGTAVLLLVDLDNFKEINDSFGHPMGDEVLKRVAELLAHRSRKTDVLARFGGDEFALLLVESGPEQGEAVAQAMVTVVREHPFILAGRNVRVTVSIGVAVIDPKCKDDIFSAADFAMYDAKRAGRDRHATFNPAVDRTQQVSSQMNEAAHVKAAINEGRFVLYCQPIRDLATNTITQHEILLRLREDELAEPLRPAAFLYIAERYGLIQSLDIMVIRQAVELVKRAQKLGRELVLSINLSGKSLGDPTLAMTIEDLITSSRVNPKNLIFELTETAAITNLDQARDFGEMLHNLGCQLALDDFGAGFASFYYL
ncbi:MAG TPA: diguanylate cyclase, partial [Candidatus Dormibacteraeota bacterium]|nr:diguanylate cyclase [Candidatus Dormibacteraeota bacterium]